MIAAVASAPSQCKAPAAGHTRWCNGNTFYDGFTTALPPNTKVLAGTPTPQDSDLVSEDEDDGGPTYSAVTSRSYHAGGVNVLFGDGSVHYIKSTIAWPTWRAPGFDRRRRSRLSRLILTSIRNRNLTFVSLCLRSNVRFHTSAYATVTLILRAWTVTATEPARPLRSGEQAH